MMIENTELVTNHINPLQQALDSLAAHLGAATEFTSMVWMISGMEMATNHTLQQALDRLEAKGLAEIKAVVSGHVW